MSSTNKQTKFKLATIPQKIKAFITDMFMIYIPILYLTTYVFMSGKEAFLSSEAAPLIAVVLYALVDALLHYKFGQTPGKKAYDLKLVDGVNGQNLSFFRALFRFFAFLFSATILFGLILPFFRKDKKTLQDILARSVVIELKDS